MADLGRAEDAWAAVQKGWEQQALTGSAVYAALLHIVEARLHLRLHRAADAAMDALRRRERIRRPSAFPDTRIRDAMARAGASAARR